MASKLQLNKAKQVQLIIFDSFIIVYQKHGGRMVAQRTQSDKQYHNNKAGFYIKESDVECENRQKIIQLHKNTPNQKKQPNSSPAEGPIEKLIRVKGLKAAIKALYAGIVKYTCEKEFGKADRLRDKLVEVAPLALTEIAKADEIIEQRKIAAMDLEKITPWKDLYSIFTTSESVAFYFALKDRVVKSNQPVFEQGSCDNRLYFILSGRLKLSYFDKEKRKKVTFAILKKGDITGIETFFSFSIHTTTLVATEESKISYLDKDAFQKILTDNPTIESKLYSYCKNKKQHCHIDNQKGLGRRAHKRYETSLRGHVQKIDKAGKPQKEISRMTIADISAGGLCYNTTNLKIGDAADLHKSDILITASYNKGTENKEFQRLARVVSVKFHPNGECCVHVQFKEQLSERKIFEIAQYTDVTAFV